MATNHKLYISQPGFHAFKLGLKKFLNQTAEIVSESRRRRFYESSRAERQRKAAEERRADKRAAQKLSRSSESHAQY